MRYPIGSIHALGTASALWLFLTITGAGAQEATRTPAETAPAHAAGEEISLVRGLVDAIKIEAERSEQAVRITADALRSFTEILRAETQRSEEATRHEIETVERTLAKVVWLVVAIATLLGGGLAFFGVGTVRDIRRRVDAAVRAEIEKLRTEAQSTFAQQIDLTQTEFRTKLDASQKRFEELKDSAQQRASELRKHRTMSA